MSGKAVRETLGFLAVVAGLVFVGWEIQQNNVQARAATRQALADASMMLSLAVAADDGMAEEFNRWSRWEGALPEDLSAQFPRASLWVFSALRHFENVFLQFEDGVIDESVFLSYGWTNSPVVTSPLFPSYWADARATFNPDFVAAFEAEYDLAP